MTFRTFLRVFLPGFLLTDQLGSLARDHVDKTYEIQSMLPVNNQKRCGLFVKVQILAQQTPEGERGGVGCRFPRIRLVVAKCLEDADQLCLSGSDPLGRRTRTHAAVMSDCKDALPQIEGYMRVWAKMVECNCH